MANNDSPFGLKPFRGANGQPYNGSGSLYHVASGDAQVIAAGDPVMVTGTADANGIPTVTRATAAGGNYMTGVMMSLANGEGTVLRDSGTATTASTSQYILVEDNPDVSFEIQCSASIAATDISNNADLVAAAANSLGISQFELDSTTFNTTNTLQLRVLRLVPRGDNELGTNAKVEVKINLHSQRNLTGV